MYFCLCYSSKHRNARRMQLLKESIWNCSKRRAWLCRIHFHLWKPLIQHFRKSFSCHEKLSDSFMRSTEWDKRKYYGMFEATFTQAMMLLESLTVALTCQLLFNIFYHPFCFEIVFLLLKKSSKTLWSSSDIKRELFALACCSMLSNFRLALQFPFQIEWR